jgi:hypothetical protein
MRHVFVRTALVVASFGVGSCARGSDASEPTLDDVRAATEKYRQVAAALADGYVRDPLDVCETPYHLGLTQQAGVMGIHYLRRDLLGIGEDHTRLDVGGTHTDFLRPAVLVYEPQADGALELVALENLVSAAAWEAAGNRAPPMFQGRPYAYMPDDPAMTIQAHYDLHVWMYRENPDGLFAAYNRDATCEHHAFDVPALIRGTHH